MIALCSILLAQAIIPVVKAWLQKRKLRTTYRNYLLGHTSPIWELDGPESTAALQYFLTQQQIETSLEYQYNGWYFDLIKSNEEDRKRWCEGLNNVLFDMAQHYKAARELKRILEILV